MKIAYVDLIGGASGDMLLGALLDAGLPLEALRQKFRKLPVSGWTLDVKKITKQGIAATSVDVLIKKQVTLRNLQIIESLLKKSTLPKVEIEESIRIFRRLAKAEAKVHGTTIDTIHFHEIGAVDTMIDVVGAICGFRLLDVDRIGVSPFPIAHAGPATMELMKDYPSFGVNETHETVTPTGAAILTTMATSFAPYPPMTVKRIGYGAGAHELNHPNVLRLVIGESNNANADTSTESLVLLETNIDDLNPQIYDYVSRRLFDAGALDVWITPVQMKKQRPGVLFSILCEIQKSEDLTSILFEEGVTLGVRRSTIERMSLPREIVTVRTRYGKVRVKIARFRGRIVRVSPEYDDCSNIAEIKKIPIQRVIETTMEAWRKGQRSQPRS